MKSNPLSNAEQDGHPANEFLWESVEDWRENVQVSALGLVFSLLLLAFVVASFPRLGGRE